MANWQRRWRWTLRIGSPLLRAGFRVDITAPDLPEGPLVVAANHYSFIDPPIVGMALQRPMRFLAVSDLWAHPRPFVRLLEGYGAVPLPVGGRPLAAMRIARDHLSAGGTVGIFPEGRRVAAWGDESAKRGAAWLALRTGAPLVPVYLRGTDATLSVREPRFRLVPVAVSFAPPIDPAGFSADRAGVDALGRAWEAAMGRLVDEGTTG